MYIKKIADSPQLQCAVYGIKIFGLTFNIIKHKNKIKISII